MIRFVDRFSSSGLANSAADCLSDTGVSVRITFKPRHQGDHRPFILGIEEINTVDVDAQPTCPDPSFSEGFSARLNGAEILACPYIADIGSARFEAWVEGYRSAESYLTTFDNKVTA
jgi:hypothetical protein